MELYHDEYSVFYEYENESKDGQHFQNGNSSHDDFEDVIEVPPEESGADDEEHVQATAVNGKKDEYSDFDEDYDDDDDDEEEEESGNNLEDDDSQMAGQNCETLENNDGTYRCPLCPKEVVSKYNLKRHMMIHTGEKPHKCPTCYKGFREQSDLRKHKKVHIYGNRLFECNICARSYLSYKSTKCYYCDGDDEDLPPPNTYDEDASKLYNCFLCSATQLTTTQLKQHLIQVHPATSRVTYGANVSSSSNGNGSGGGNNSIKSVSRKPDDMEKIHKCNVCSKAFRSKQFLMLHTLTHANNRIESAF